MINQTVNENLGIISFCLFLMNKDKVFSQDLTDEMLKALEVLRSELKTVAK
jgi:hypothetical protein